MVFREPSLVIPPDGLTSVAKSHGDMAGILARKVVDLQNWPARAWAPEASDGFCGPQPNPLSPSQLPGTRVGPSASLIPCPHLVLGSWGWRLDRLEYPTENRGSPDSGLKVPMATASPLAGSYLINK